MKPFNFKMAHGLFGLCLMVGAGCAGVEENAGVGTVNPLAEQEAVAMRTADPAGHCPQTRATSPAPEPFTSMVNPLPASNENISGGRLLFHEDARPMPCETCHGFKGNGFGVIFQQMKPYPRDFTCYQVMSALSDGQLFWIIKSGSHGTRMKGFAKLTDDQAWQLVHYIRHLSE